MGHVAILVEDIIRREVQKTSAVCAVLHVHSTAVVFSLNRRTQMVS